MNHRKNSDKHQWEMISLIDVIFLLLIFAFMIPGGTATGLKPGDTHNTLLIRFRPVTQGDIYPCQRVVLSAPFMETDSAEYCFDADYSTATDAAFAELEASRKILDCIDRYHEYRYSRDYSVESIRVSPTRETPFRILDFLVRQTSLKGDSVLVFVPGTE